jgi:hypothetical protein
MLDDQQMPCRLEDIAPIPLSGSLPCRYQGRLKCRLNHSIKTIIRDLPIVNPGRNAKCFQDFRLISARLSRPIFAIATLPIEKRPGRLRRGLYQSENRQGGSVPFRDDQQPKRRIPANAPGLICRMERFCRPTG